MEQELENQLLYPTVSKSDVDQQIALLKLEGHTEVSRNIVVAELRGRERSYLSALDSEMDFTPLWKEANFTESQFYAIDRIIKWVAKQSDEVQGAVFQFLEDPTTEKLNLLISFLADLGLVKSRKKDRSPHHRTGVTITELIRKTLRANPQPIEELYELGRLNINTQRPEATVRQALRRMVSRGQVRNTDGVFIWIGGEDDV